jgi:hypothetical protein
MACGNEKGPQRRPFRKALGLDWDRAVFPPRDSNQLTSIALSKGYQTGKPKARFHPSPILPMNCGKPHTGKGMKGTKPGTKGTKKGK